MPDEKQQPSASDMLRAIHELVQEPEEDVASKLINELLHDLKSFQNLNSARAQAVRSIRQLSLSLDRPQSLHAREWEAADQAAEAWCRKAFH